MRTVPETLLAPETRPRVIADFEKLVDKEVADMSGVTGTAVRLAYKTVSAFDSGHIPAMIETILPNVAEALQPYWASFAADPAVSGGDFGAYLASREDEVAGALLAITDSRQRASSRPTIVKAYKTVRGSAVKHVKAGLPALGQLVQGYMLFAGGCTACGRRPPAPPITEGLRPSVASPREDSQKSLRLPPASRLRNGCGRIRRFT